MIKTTLLSITTALALAAIGHASIVTLSGTRTGPTVVSSGGSLVTDGLVRLGAFTGTPASSSVADIDAVFAEFGTGTTGAAGRLGQTFNNTDAAAFNNDQIYIWVFNGADVASSSQYGVFGLANPPGPGNWVYPAHTGAGSDSVTLPLTDLLAADAGDTTITPGVVYDLANGQFALIPEPSGTLLAGLAGALLVFRRRR